MGYFGQMLTALGHAYHAYREGMTNADPSRRRAMFSGRLDEWSSWEARSLRYDINWAMYQNNAYRELVHGWSTKFKTDQGVYKYIRHIYNPAGQLGDFYGGHIWGGTLDVDAGDGEAASSALPIVTENKALRVPIAKLRRDSKWQVNKDVFTLWGAVLGDAAIKICDDPGREQIRKELVYPGHLTHCDFDEQKNVIGYTLRKVVIDPRTTQLDANGHRKNAVYTERCTKAGPDSVTFETFIDDMVPFPWNEVTARWDEPYPFVPMVVVNHRSIGLDWGAGCFHGSLSQFIEIDDQASCLSDNNRKQLGGPWLISGVNGERDLKSANVDRSQRGPAENAANPDPSRTTMNFLYGPVGATATSLTKDVNILGVCQHIQNLLEAIEKKHPELLADAGLGGRVTAEAVRNARALGASRVQACRPGYDDCEVRSNQMGVAMGGLRGYKDYQGFGMDSYEAGALDHSIGHRSVFEVDPMDELAEKAARWTAIGLEVESGVPIRLALERDGWTEDDLAKFDQAKAADPPPAGPPLPPLAPPRRVLIGGNVAQVKTT